MLFLFASLNAHALNPAHVAEVARTAEMSVEQVTALLEPFERDESVIRRLANPAERKPWYVYRDIMITEERVTKGRAFRDANRLTLARAEALYGVPQTVILGILGVETLYGEKMGQDVIARSLYTLGFHTERRGAFFRAELGHFLRLASEQHWDITTVTGSYAGAMGMGQFMPSSYRKWAVDFDGDGAIDLFRSSADAIGSIAHYLKVHGWAQGAPVMLEVSPGADLSGLVTSGLGLDQTLGALERGGLVTTGPVLAEATPARLFAFEIPGGKEYRVGLQNFYVITRYNQSALYARAVYDLGAAL